MIEPENLDPISKLNMEGSPQEPIPYHTHNGIDSALINASAAANPFNPSVAGNDTELQFNDGGAFGADSNLKWDNNVKELILGSESSGGALHGGDAASADTSGAELTFISGEPNGDADGAALFLVATNSGITGGNGGPISITTGSSQADDGNGGNFNISLGSKDGTGINGKATITLAGVTGNIVTTFVITLSDGATPALDASLGYTFLLVAGGNRTIAIPTNPTSGQKIVIAHTASGGARTLALNTGTGGFRFGTSITALTSTDSGKTDYIGCIYNVTDNKWDVVAYSKNF